MKHQSKPRTIWIWFVFLVVMSITACTTAMRKTSLAEDPGSSNKVQMLKERASQYWSLMAKGNLKEAYAYYDPFFRAKMSPEEFIEKHSAVKYREATVTNVKVEGNIGTVTVKVKYFVPKVKVRQKEFEVTETTTDFEERWLFIYDNWYKEYYLRYFDSGVAFY
ncbi:MAG: hypothetical protein ACP5TY_09095 [Thermodesulforhabdaceae bacterium]